MMPLTKSSLLLALIALSAEAAAAAPATALGACSWDRPGQNPFMGDLVAAVDRYQDIPAPVRARLKTRMAERAYDEIVSIGRDRIVGRARYGAEIRDMHFGSGQVCGTVSRAGWATGMQERGLVYCEADHCILVPTVCRNVSRITREGPAVAGASGARGGGGGGAPATSGSSESTATEGAPAPADTASADQATGVAGSTGAAGTGGETLVSAGGTPTAADLGAGGGAATAPAPGAVAAPDSWIAALGLGGVMAAAPDASNPGGTALPLGAHGTPANDLADSGSLKWRPSTDELPAGPWPGGIDQPTAAVPEPGSWALMIGGLVGLAALARRRARLLSRG